MDGHFVPNITIGPPVVRAIKRVATRPLDVHLMIEEPDRYIEDVRRGRRQHGVGARRGGAAPAPHAQLIASSAPRPAPCSTRRRRRVMLEDVAADVDFVLVMSVNPGFGGQAFIPHSLEKMRRVRAVLRSRRFNARRSRSTAAST